MMGRGGGWGAEDLAGFLVFHLEKVGPGRGGGGSPRLNSVPNQALRASKYVGRQAGKRWG